MDRATLLDRYREVHMAIEQRDWDEPQADLHELRLLVEERLELHDVYASSLRAQPLSRCPLTGEVVSSTIDREDLDGLWWNADHPIRPDAPAPATLLGFSGAIPLDEAALPETPFRVCPGPERPFVVPSVLEAPDVVAVVSSVGIGGREGFAIVYFAPAEVGARRTAPPTWGVPPPPDPSDRDFDLTPWMETERLLWIAPHDATLTLQGGAVRCPYLEAAGDERDATIFEGTLWRADGREGARLR